MIKCERVCGGKHLRGNNETGGQRSPRCKQKRQREHENPPDDVDDEIGENACASSVVGGEETGGARTRSTTTCHQKKPQKLYGFSTDQIRANRS